MEGKGKGGRKKDLKGGIEGRCSQGKRVGEGEK